MERSDRMGLYAGAIRARIQELQEQISRLQTANAEIGGEQQSLLQEIKMIKEPELAPSWKGVRSDEYDDKRELAYNNMQWIGNAQYDTYQSSISEKISSLKAEIASLYALLWSLENNED